MFFILFMQSAGRGWCLALGHLSVVGSELQLLGYACGLSDASVNSTKNPPTVKWCTHGLVLHCFTDALHCAQISWDVINQFALRYDSFMAADHIKWDVL